MLGQKLKSVKPQFVFARASRLIAEIFAGLGPDLQA